jgi:HlyD family secretion protein
MKPTAIFRQAALERLSSPERLDTLMLVTTPRAWFALAALGAVIAGALTWGVFGAAPDSIGGRGMMVREGLFPIDAKATGLVRDLHLRVGDTVSAGQIIARLTQAEVEDGLRHAQARLAETERNRDVNRVRVGRDTSLERVSIAQQRHQAEQSIESTRARIQFIQERVAAQEELQRGGLITREAYQGTVNQLADARDGLASAEAQLRALSARESSLQTQAGQTVTSLEQAAADARRQIETLESQLETAGVVRSPYEGRVVELLTDEGALVVRGQSLVTVERTDAPLRGLVFVGGEAKQVAPGMRVQLSPAGVAWEEYGYLLGRVVSVSDSPLSPTAMNVLLRNDALVRDFTSHGAAYVVTVDLERDPTTRSGFRWTSRQGPSFTFGGGTLCEAKITLAQRRPITLVVPALRRWLGI